MPQSSEQNLQTVRALYDAYSSRDVEALLGTVHDDEFEIYQSESFPWGGTYKGKDGLMEFVKNSTSYYDPRVVVEELVEAGDDVIVIGRSQGTIKATGETFDVRLVDVCRLRDGKLVSVDIFLDTPAILQKLGK